MSNKSSDQAQYDRELKGIARGMLVGLGANIGTKAVAFVSMAVITRALGGGGYGLFALGRTLTTMVARLSGIGLPHAVVRFVSMADAEDDRDMSQRVLVTCSLLTLVGSLTVAAAIFALAGVLADNVFKKPEMRGILMVMAACIPLTGVSAIWTSGPVARRSMNATALTQVGRTLVLLVGVVLLTILLAPTALHVSWVWLVACVASTVIAAAGLVRAFPRFAWGNVDGRIVRTLLGFAFPVLIVMLLDMGLYRINILLGGRWLSKADLGFYSLSSSIAELVIYSAMAVSTIFRPTVSALHKQNKLEELGNVFQTATRWGLYLTMPVSMVILMKGSSVLTIFGKDFVAGLPVLYILCISQVVFASAGSAGTMLVMSGKQWQYSAIGVVMMVVNLALCWLLLPVYGMVGLAIGASVGRAGRNLWAMIMVQRHYGITPYRWRVMKPILASLIAAPVLLLSLSKPLPDVLVLGLLHVAVFAVVCWRMGMPREDYDVLRAVNQRVRSIWIQPTTEGD